MKTHNISHPKYLLQKTSSRSCFERALGALLVVALLVWPALMSRAATITWTDGTASYNIPANWDSNSVPGSADVALNNQGTNSAVRIGAADPAWTVVDLQAGNDTNGPVGGAFELNGSTLNVNGWMRLGMTTNSTGRFAINDGTLNFGDGRIQTGEGSGSLTVIEINGGLIHKTGGGVGLNFSDGGWGGQHSATTLVTQTGGTITSSGDIWIGQFTGGVATYDLHNGAINTSNWFVVSRAGSIGTLNMDGGSITHEDPDHTGQPAFIIGDRAGTGGGIGVFNFSSGTVETIGAEYWIGNGEAASATNNLSGDASLTVNHWMAIGRENSVGELNISGNAVLNKTGNGNITIGTGGGIGGVGIINQNGGSISNLTTQVWLGEFGGSSGLWNLNGGQTVLNILEISHAGSAIGTFNLNGGSLTVNEIRKSSPSGTATFNFNGGILKAAEDNPDFMRGLDTVDIQAGGAVIDSQGFDVTISSTLFDVFSSGGSLTKQGAGTLRLAGFDFYSGPTLINTGKLITSTASTASGDYTVADSAGFGVDVTFAGAQFSANNVTLGSSGATSLDFDLGSFGNPSAFSAPLNVFGTLAVNSTVTVNVTDGLPQVGQFPLVKYGSKSGTGTFVIGSLPTGVMASIVDNTANNSIDLDITQVDVVRWDGQDGGTWDIGATTNWVNPGTGLPAAYADGNPAIFNDDALGTTSVNITTTVSPNGVTADSSFLDYTLTGSGKITGPVGLTKQGSGTFTIQNTGGNDYSGPTRIEDGTVAVTNLANGNSPSAIGASSANPTNLVLAGGTLKYSGPAVSVDRGYSFSTTNNPGLQVDTQLALTGKVSPTPGSVFLKTGTGTLAYTGTGTNQIANGGVGGSAGFPGYGAYNVVAGTVLLDGTGGGQTNYTVGQFWVGGTTNSGAALVMSNSTLVTSDWIGLGRANGSDNFLSSITMNDSRIRLTGGGFSAGYDAGLPLDLGIQMLARQELTLNGSSAIEVANGPMFFAERRGATATVLLNNTSSMTNSANAAVGIGAGGSLTGSTGSVVIADSALWRVGSYLSIGNEGGTGSILVRDSGTLSVGGDLNVTDVGTSTGTLMVRDNGQVNANNLFVGKDNDASGVLTITNNAAVVANNGVTMARFFNGTPVIPTAAIVNLSGGSLTVNQVQGTDNSGTDYGTFNFNGGKLIARNPVAGDFMFNLAAINVMSGGATIDSDTNDIAITQALLDAGGGGGLTKMGSGALYLNGANTYTGTTLVSGGTLGGTGSFVGPVSVAAGGTLAPATSIGIMTINNTLSLAGTTVMEVSRDSGAPDSDRVNGVTTLTYGGTLTVTNVGTNALQVGDTFFLFNATTINPAAFAVLDLPAGYTWNTGQLNVNGSISVQSVAANVEFDQPVKSGGNLVLSGMGGIPGGTYYLRASTNVALPVGTWPRVSTNVFDGSGNFSLTNTINPASPRLFYSIETP